MITKSRVKYIQSLNEKKLREEYGVFVAEGPKIISELLSCTNIEAVAVYATGEWWKEHESVKQIPFLMAHEVTGPELERISFLSTPHQVLGIFKRPVFDEAGPLHQNITLLLDGIQDPGNLGTIIRIADWFGLAHVIASPDTADVFNPKVVQSTMGSLGRVKVSYLPLEEFIAEHRHIPVYASTLAGMPVQSTGKIRQGLLLVGNESKGLRPSLIKLADHQLTISKAGGAESLNAAVATGIILSHIM